MGTKKVKWYRIGERKKINNTQIAQAIITQWGPQPAAPTSII